MNDLSNANLLRVANYASVLDHAPDSVLVCDRAGMIVYANPAVEHLFGYPAGGLLGQPIEQLVPIDRRAQHARQREFAGPHYRSHTMANALDIAGRHADGHDLPLSIRLGSTTTADGDMVIAFITDLTDLRRREGELRRLNRALNLVHDCNETLVRARDEAGLLSGIIEHLQRTGGYPAVWVGEAIDPDAPPPADTAIRLLGASRAPDGCDIPAGGTAIGGEAVRKREPVVWRNAHTHADDRVAAWIALPFPREDGLAGCLVIGAVQPDAFNADERRLLVELADDLAYGLTTLRGRMELTRQADQLRQHLDYDDLTGLPNRHLLMTRTAEALSAIPRSTAGLLVLGLDHFTRINETFGHAAGDRMLIRIADRLRGAVRRGDSLARLPGDEFAVLLTSLATPADADLVVAKIREALREPLECAEHSVVVTVAIGACLSDETHCDAATLIGRAETAMFAAKASGRNSYAHFCPSMHLANRQRMHLEHELHTALERNELAVHYQPQIDLASGQIAGAEALLRWNHPELGRISPSEFIPVAEDTGLILPIGAWVLDTACRQVATWRALGLPSVTVAVNLSSRQFREPGLEAAILATLARHALPPEALVLEVTESLLMDDIEATRAMLWRLKSQGISLALDDFGTGYSSLAYLKRLPLTTVKIDRAFVRDLTRDPNDAAIVAAVIAMADAMGLTVVAEGVETEAQLEFLRQKGCHEIQGYWFSPAVDAAAFEALLRANRRAVPAAADELGVLLVDDEPSVVAAIRRVLRREGYPIHVAYSGEDGLEILARHRIGVIISDQRMPGMNGTEFLMRARRLHPDTVRIILSGYADLDAVTEAVNTGALFRFLTKPWDNDALRETVRSAFRNLKRSPDGAPPRDERTPSSAAGAGSVPGNEP